MMLRSRSVRSTQPKIPMNAVSVAGPRGNGDFAQIEDTVGEPVNIGELTLLVRCKLAVRDYAGARAVLSELSDAVGLPMPQRHDLEALIAATEATGRT